MDIRETRPPEACRYVVAPRLGLWRVLRNDRDSRTFADRGEAVRFACDAARRHAVTGAVGVVVVRDEVDELHCYSPPADRAVQRPRPRLRLVGGSL